MENYGILKDVLVFLAAAIVFVSVFRRLGASPIVGYLVAGMLIGPFGLGFIGDVEGARGLAEMGIVFLLFSIGLELSFKRLRTLRWQVFGLGTAQVVVTALVIGGIVLALGSPPQAAIVIGGGLALSSTAVVLQLLTEKGEISGRVGRTSFAILLLQDLAVVPLLAMVPLLGRQGGGDWITMAIPVATALLAVVTIVVVGRLLLRPLFRITAASGQAEVTVALSLLAILGTAWATEAVGLSLTLGAFLAGLLLSETEFRHQVHADIKPFRGLLLGLFFMSIGMSIDLGYALDNVMLIAILVLTLVVLKTAITATMCRISGLPFIPSLRVGLLLAQGGEFAFILVGLAMEFGVIDGTIGQLSLVVGGTSLIITPFLAAAGRLIGQYLERYVAVGLAAIEEENQDLSGHVVVGGFGRMGQAVAKVFDAHKIPYVAIDMDARKVMEMREQGRPIYFGDASRPDLLWGVGIDRARAALVVMNDTEAAGRMVALLRRGFPDMDIVARARDEKHGEELALAGATSTVAETLEVSLQLAGRVLRRFGIPDSDIGKLFDTTGGGE